MAKVDLSAQMKQLLKDRTEELSSKLISDALYGGSCTTATQQRAINEREMRQHMVDAMTYGNSFARMYHDGKDLSYQSYTPEEMRRDTCIAWQRERSIETGETKWTLNWEKLEKLIYELARKCPEQYRRMRSDLQKSPENLDKWFGLGTYQAVMTKNPKGDHPTQKRLREMAMAYGGTSYWSDTTTTGTSTRSAWHTKHYVISKEEKKKRAELGHAPKARRRSLVRTFPFKQGALDKTPLDTLEKEFNHFAGDAKKYLFG